MQDNWSELFYKITYSGAGAMSITDYIIKFMVK